MWLLRSTFDLRRREAALPAAADRKPVQRVRVAGRADGRVIVLGQDGSAAVLKHGPVYEVLATNRLDDRFDASPALVDNEVYLRGYRFLYCVAAD
jgi:hypothetical protein